MFVQIESTNEKISFNDVKRVIFHTNKGDLDFTPLQSISYNKSYNSFTLIRTSSETTFNHVFQIIKVVQ